MAVNRGVQWRWMLGVLMSLLFAAAAVAEDSVAPDINRQYQSPVFIEWQESFERSGREVYDRRDAIVAASGVRAGMVVVDIGAGTGLFTLLFAQAVGPQGKVYAVDIAPNFVHGIERRAVTGGVHNVVGVVNSAQSLGLAPASIDLAFVCDTYHHFEYPLTMLAQIRQALRPGGRLIVIDYRREAGVSSGWVMGHVRADAAAVRDEIAAAGFVLTAQPALLRDNYFFIFEIR